MTYWTGPAWYERLEKWVDRDGRLDAGYQAFQQFEVEISAPHASGDATRTQGGP